MKGTDKKIHVQVKSRRKTRSFDASSEFKSQYQSQYYWKEVVAPTQKIPPGAVVEILDAKENWIARGFYNGHARLRLRVLTFVKDEDIDFQFFKKRLDAALLFRRKIIKDTDSYRIVHSEADDLSGLVIDKLGSQIVIEYFSAGMFHWRKAIERWLSEEFEGLPVYSFSDRHIQKQESFDLYSNALPETVIVEEDTLKFLASPGRGHKTGFFLDQRENRRQFSKLSKDRRVLDLCCHTGGFAIHAIRGGAIHVDAVDYDEVAIEIAKKNASLNTVKVDFHTSDLFPWMEERIIQGLKWDLIILDPPKQTRSSDGISRALRRYFAMNRMALQLLSSEGILVTCSCSGWISELEFINMLGEAAMAAGRKMQIFNVSGAGSDHPFLPMNSLGRYLKVVWARVA